MAIVQHVIEYTQARVQDGIIRGVKIVGTASKNGYRYPPGTLGQAVTLYENAPVYVLHPDEREKKRNTRKLEEHFGNLQNIRADDTGIWGDLHVKQSHPMAGVILESDGSKFGLSHNVRVEMNDDRTEVTRIVSVNSVDLVDNPATTRNLFEEFDQMELAEMVEATKANADAITKLTEGQDRLVTLFESKFPPGTVPGEEKPEEKPEEKSKEETQAQARAHQRA